MGNLPRRPPSLKGPPESWPVQPTSYDLEEAANIGEVRKQVEIASHVVEASETWDPLQTIAESTSSFDVILGRVHRARRLFEACRNSVAKRSGHPKPFDAEGERIRALRSVIKWLQR